MGERPLESKESIRRWTLGFGITLGALALLAGWYVPRPATLASATATPRLSVAVPTTVVTPTAEIATSTPESTVTPQPTATIPSQTPTSLPTPSPTASPTALPTASPTPSPAPTAAPIVHIVQPGDTVDDLADKYGVTPQAIIDANNLSTPDSLAEGQRLIIPKPSAQ